MAHKTFCERFAELAKMYNPGWDGMSPVPVLPSGLPYDWRNPEAVALRIDHHLCDHDKPWEDCADCAPFYEKMKEALK